MISFEDIKKANETWKDIKNYEDLYQVSNLGRVKSLKRNTKNQYKHIEIIKSCQINNNGYISVKLYKNNKCKNFYVHRLVAETFIPNLNNLLQVNHINGNKQDNRAENLEWVSASQNTKHAYKTNLIKPILRPVQQFSKDMELLKEWQSIKQVEDNLGINHSNIITVCKGNTNRKFAGGFIWKYKEVI